VVKVNQEITTKVTRNTIIAIENKNKDFASVDLKATSDLGLSMTYNQ
jgi:hypothetical protein